MTEIAMKHQHGFNDLFLFCVSDDMIQNIYFRWSGVYRNIKKHVFNFHSENFTRVIFRKLQGNLT